MTVAWAPPAARGGRAASSSSSVKFAKWAAPLLLAAFLLAIFGTPPSWQDLTLQPIVARLSSTPGRPAPLPKLPWAPLLTGEELRRGISHYGGGARLREVAAKLVAGQPLTTVMLGGSNTFGHGVEDQSLAFPARFADFLNASWPHSGHQLLNRGIPGVTAAVTAPCIASLVPRGADLIVVEFSINESPGKPFTSPDRQAFEWLLRELLALPGRPAVLLLHSYRWWRAAGDGEFEGLFYTEPEPQLELFAHYYDLPSLSVRSAAYHLMRAGIEGFKVDKVLLPGSLEGRHWTPIPVAEEGTEAHYSYVDPVHPSASGHQLLAELLAGLLTVAADEVASGRELSARSDPRLEGLPPPMIPNYQQQRASLCMQQKDFEPAVKQQEGFTYKAERPQLEREIEQKWGWSSDTPGAWAELELDTRLSNSKSRGGDGSSAKAARTAVHLSHLRSYEKMGTADVECVGGCSCEPSVLDGTHSDHTSVFIVHSVEVSQHPRCRLRVTVRRQPGRVPHEGHKVMLSGVMVVHALKN